MKCNGRPVAQYLHPLTAGLCPMNEHFSRWIADRIPAYLDSRAADLEALRRALAENDLSRIQDLAHKMKGTGCSYGFDEITKIGALLEEAAKARNTAEIDRWISSLSDCLDRITTPHAKINDGSKAGPACGAMAPDHHPERRRD